MGFTHEHAKYELFTLEQGVKAYMFERCACGAIRRDMYTDPGDGANEVTTDWNVPLYVDESDATPFVHALGKQETRAVFCTMLPGEVMYDHISIHLETASCVNPVSAYEAMKPTSQELAAEIAKLYKYDAEHGDEIARRIHAMHTEADWPVQS